MAKQAFYLTGITVLLTISFSLHSAATSLNHHGVQIPQKTVLVFDFHSVLADTNYPAAIAMGLISLPITIPTIIYRTLWTYPFWKNYKGGYPWKALIDAFAPASSQQRLRPLTKEALEQAYAAGHQLYLFSNITPTPYAILSRRYQDFLSKFKPGFTSAPDNGWLSKKDVQAFQRCQDAIRKEHPNAVITLFDDRQENCTQGQKLGWSVVKVTSDDQCAQEIQKITTAQQN